MDAVERAIRNALEKGDARDRAFREKIYRSAFAALERSLEKAGAATGIAHTRRQGLKAKITAIESEFIPAAPPRQAAPPPPPQRAESASQSPARPAAQRPAEPTVPPPHLAPSPRNGNGDVSLPRIERDDASQWRERDNGGDDDLEGRLDVADARRPRRSFAYLFTVASIVAAIGIGAWWTLDSGILMSPSERDTSVPNPPRVLEEDEFEPAGTASAPSAEPRAATGEWMTVFTPSDPTTVDAPGSASAEVVQGEDGPFLRIRSSTSDAGVTFDVGQGILEALAGRRALFSLSAKAEEGQETQLSISCNFGELGDCGRRRYVVRASPSDYLFEVDLPDRQPGAGGIVLVIPDIEGRGRAVDVFEIKASTAD